VCVSCVLACVLCARVCVRVRASACACVRVRACVRVCACVRCRPRHDARFPRVQRAACTHARTAPHVHRAQRSAAHVRLLVPAGLTAARDGAVHDVVRHQEEGLQLRGCVTQTQTSAGATHRARAAVCASEAHRAAQGGMQPRLIACRACVCKGGGGGWRGGPTTPVLCVARVGSQRRSDVVCVCVCVCVQAASVSASHTHPLDAPAQHVGPEDLLLAQLLRGRGVTCV
jgi:hypothetical protein